MSLVNVAWETGWAEHYTQGRHNRCPIGEHIEHQHVVLNEIYPLRVFKMEVELRLLRRSLGPQ